jgi:putative tryptophan/tyrosine transport system substrate-binding protein
LSYSQAQGKDEHDSLPAEECWFTPVRAIERERIKSVRLAFVTFVMALIPCLAEPQTRVEPVRIGILSAGTDSAKSFSDSLQQLGYVEGQNIILDHRSAEGNLNLLPYLIGELLRLKPAVIVASGPTATAPTIAATRMVPIVMVDGGNPISRGFVETLALPGGNVTGISGTTSTIDGKQLELLKDACPSISRVTVLNAINNPGLISRYERVAKALGVMVDSVELQDGIDLERAFARISAAQPHALITARNFLTLRYSREIADYALRMRLPSMFGSRGFVQDGGLMSYGLNTRRSWQRAAIFVDKILKGANPASLPVERPLFELVVNLQTANKIGRIIPPEILLEANEVLK